MTDLHHEIIGSVDPDSRLQNGEVAQPSHNPWLNLLPPTSDTLSGPVIPEKRHGIADFMRRRFGVSVTVGLVMLTLFAGTLSGWIVAQRQSSSAGQWRRMDVAEVATSKALTSALGTARASIATLNGQVLSLQSQNGDLTSQLATAKDQVTSTQAQLAELATAKEKVQDQNSVLNTLLVSAGAVSTKLQTCVTQSNSVWSQLVDDINYGDILSDTTLTANAQRVNVVCNDAEAANKQLQSVIASTTGS